MQSIQRLGGWNRDSSLIKHYLCSHVVDAMLGAGDWEGASEKDFSSFWVEQSCMEVDHELLLWMFPMIQTIEKV